MARVLAALIRVHSNRPFRSSAPDSQQQRIENQLLPDPRLHRLVDDSTRVKIDDDRPVQATLMRANVRDVTDPGIVRLGHHKL
jgi:hypothetical protein